MKTEYTNTDRFHPSASICCIKQV